MTIKREALFSCRLEDSSLDIMDILYPEKKRINFTNVLSRYINAIDFGMGEINEGYSNQLISGLYWIIEGDESNNNEHCCFRNTQIFDIPGVFMNIETYNPTAPEDIVLVIEDLQRYINNRQQVDELIKIGLAIYYNKSF